LALAFNAGPDRNKQVLVAALLAQCLFFYVFLVLTLMP